MKHDFFTPAENARRVQRVITEPWINCRELIDVDVIVPENFRRTEYTHAVVAHPDGIIVKNARILFETDVWLERWKQILNDQPMVGISSEACGLAICGAPAQINGLHVEGSPKVGVIGWDSGGKISRLSSTRCHYGVHFSKRIRSPMVFADGFRFWDGWGPTGLPQDGWVSEGMQRFRNFEVSGNIACGVKICGPGTLMMSNYEGPSIMFQGRATMDGDERLTASITGAYLNGGYADNGGLNRPVQVSWGATVSINGGYIIGAGADVSAIQVTGDSSANIANMTIGGFNGPHGYAAEVDKRPWPFFSNLNSDFEEVNTFQNQSRKIRIENG